MGKVVLITGGARSGKSKFAEELLKRDDDVVYIATAIVTDEEMEDRIKKHRERRNSKWTTFEGYSNLDKVVVDYPSPKLLLDCVTIMMTNLMFEEEKNFDNIKEEQVDIILEKIKREFIKFIEEVKKKDKTLIMVTNEVGSGLVPEYKLGRIFRDIAGTINQLLAAMSDEVYFVTCGIPMKIK